MNNELRDRDLLWCKALAATLDAKDIAVVTAEFNRIRPDKAAQPLRAGDGAICPDCHEPLVNGVCLALHALQDTPRP